MEVDGIMNIKKRLKSICYKILGSPKEKMRRRRHSDCLRYLESISNTSYGRYFTYDLVRTNIRNMGEKYSDKDISDIATVLVKTRFCRTVEFIEKTAKDDIRKKDLKLLDAGDASGIFIKYFGKDGISLNVDKAAVNFLKSIGIKALEGDILRIPLPDDAVDYSFAFEIIEHIEAPIPALRELGRVTKKSIFITIPHMEKTQIRDFGYWDKQNRDYDELERIKYQYHIHEFSVDDIRKIAHQAGLIVRSKEPCLPSIYPRFIMLELNKLGKK